jgi:hypothetical protein
MVLETDGRSHDCETLVGPQRHGVEPIDNNVDQSFFSDDVDRHVGISAQAIPLIGHDRKSPARGQNDAYDSNQALSLISF